ncbi:hypothetical protein BGZ94_000033 [Podila epigama]|nr:hypothetical protein BGZ94_000033 [Podila epigama]
MKFWTATALLTVTTLGLLCSSPFSGSPVGVSARLTAEERKIVERRDPDNPNYCPACLKKAMSNHFPHACPQELARFDEHPTQMGPKPEEERCVCVAFMELSWMKADCQQECTFVKDERAMASFVKPMQMPGCAKFINFETGEVLEVDGIPNKDPDHKPVVYDKDDDSEEVEEASEEKKTSEDDIKDNDGKNGKDGQANDQQEQEEIAKEHRDEL